MAVQDFRECLEWSQKASDEPFWLAVYRKAFPNMTGWLACPDDSEAQRQGVDRMILLGNNREFRIDEKKRSSEYGDIALEYVSNDTRNTPGWIEKDLSIDYLAYAFMESKRCYLFPWPFLRSAWAANKAAWFKKAEDQLYLPRRDREYQYITAQNNGYNTLSLAVPINVLYQAVNRAMRIELD